MTMFDDDVDGDDVFAEDTLSMADEVDELVYVDLEKFFDSPEDNDRFGEWVAETTGHDLMINPRVKIVFFDAENRRFQLMLSGYYMN